jgi:DNA-binding LacI/PurR family transcriptional regulator
MRSEPIYLEIKKYLMYLITQNQHDKLFLLPSEKQLCIRFTCSRITARRAMDELKNENMIISVPGRGSFIKQAAENAQPFYKSKSVCLIMPNLDTDYYRALLKGISNQFSQSEIFLFCTFTKDAKLTEEMLIDSAIGKMFDGLLVHPVIHDVPSDRLIKLVSKNYPLLFVGRSPLNSMTNRVCCDDEALICNAMDFLMDNGHSNIGFITEETNVADNYADRIRAYKEYVSGKRIPARLCETDFFSGATPQERGQFITDRLDRFFRINPEITALISSDKALEYLEPILIGRGIRPEQISLISIDRPENPVAVRAFPNVLYVDQNPENIGRLAAEHIARQIFNGTPPVQIKTNSQICRLADGQPFFPAHCAKPPRQ